MIQNTETSLYQQAGLSFYPYESMIRMNIQFHRFNHIFRFQDRIQVFFGKNVMFQHQLIHSFTRFQSLLRYLCRMFIANYGIQCGHYSYTVVYIPTAFSSLAVMPSIHKVRNVSKPFINKSADSKQHCAMTGSIAFSSICAASPLIATQRSFPITL